MIGALGFAALGVWQVDRRAWKLDLIARVEARVHAAPTALPPVSAWSQVTEQADAYRRVRVTGSFDYAHETLVKALTEQGSGFWVVTPLRSDRGVVLINRGFVPDDKAAPAARSAGQARGLVTIVGLLRITEPGGGFLRSNDPVADRWYSRDVAAIARARRVGPVAPFFVDADATANPAGYPVGGLTVVQFRNSHLVYALTWFALAGLCLFAVYLGTRRRRRA